MSVLQKKEESKVCIDRWAATEPQCGDPWFAASTSGWYEINRSLQQMFHFFSGTITRSFSGATKERSPSQRDADEQRLHVMLRVVKDYAIFVVDSAGDIATWNEGAQALYCYRESEILGRSLASVFFDMKEGESLLRVARLTGRAETEGWCVRKDGSRFWAACILTAVLNADGSLNGFVNITRDRTERRKADEALRHMHAEVEGQAERIAHALHDDSGQLLALVRIALDDLASEMPSSAKPKVKKIVDQLDQIESRLREFSHELSPTVVDNLGFEGAVRALVDSFSRRTKIATELHCKALDNLSSAMKISLYRIAQEALTNIWRHAKATRVTIEFLCDGKVLTGVIRDNGVGFDVGSVRAKAGGGLGLAGIEARISLLLGSFSIASEPGRGSELSLTVPVAREHVYQDLVS
jgi:PAS domain S-box-containing protein